MADIVGICQEMDREVTLGVLGPILVKKHQPKGACVRRRAAETRHSFLGGSLHEQSGSYWSYLEVPMNSHYVGRRLCTRIGQRKPSKIDPASWSLRVEPFAHSPVRSIA